MVKKKYIEIGKVTTTHGIKGCLKVQPWFNDVDIIKNLNYIYTDSSGIIKNKIENIYYAKNHIIVKFETINSMEEAKRMNGKIIYAKREELNIKEGEILIQDLIGMEIYDYKEREKLYGRIKKVLETGANNVYVIENEEKKEKLIPAIDEVIKEKNYENEKIYIKVLEGMFDV